MKRMSCLKKIVAAGLATLALCWTASTAHAQRATISLADADAAPVQGKAPAPVEPPVKGPPRNLPAVLPAPEKTASAAQPGGQGCDFFSPCFRGSDCCCCDDGCERRGGLYAGAGFRRRAPIAAARIVAPVTMPSSTSSAKRP